MTSKIFVQNLKCGGCATTIKGKLSEMDGVNNVVVDENQNVVTISHTKEMVLAIKEKLAHLGYPEVDAKNGLLTQAKSFVSCAVGRISKS